MSFRSVKKSVGKIQKSITYWLSIILICFFIFGRLIMIVLNKGVPFFIISMNFILFIFLYLTNIKKIAIMMSI